MPIVTSIYAPTSYNTDDHIIPGETPDVVFTATDTPLEHTLEKSAKPSSYNGFKPKWMLNDAPHRFYQRVAKFFVVLPEQSRIAIWDSSVSTGEVNCVLVETNSKEHIANIICRLIIIYCKYQDRKKPKLSIKAVKPYTDEIATYIYDKHNPLEKEKFVHQSDDVINRKENDYFYRILIGFANYSKAKQRSNRST
eukprot:CAMPEP_0202694896 /NCGR_PEP_ID=MMETSP1385-20130828/8630_1 /ASSEMBLY_ACC=CAM_ASM_000861 /TAXON_ID=933848 /ORGANISM="Elphidium margaritaceum" /LENGTH=194 /DNA_ID=CAMNT_0049350827 /DNA_START=147 /DNA_END=729 /DNA_ORIENTATION=+